MRDPLRNVSVRYKLAFTFFGVCLLAFGVGGFLVSHSSREALEREILAVLRLRSQFYATALEGDLHALDLRARDFASDGYIRTRFEELTEVGARDEASVADALRRHLSENKLPLEPAFRNLALVDVAGTRVFLAEPDDSDWATDLPPEACAGAEWFSGFIVDEHTERPPSIVIGTPLHSLAGDRLIGTLLVRVRSGVWIRSALGGIEVDREVTPDFRLTLLDGDRRSLEIPRALMEQFGPAAGDRIAESGLGLRVREPGTERGAPRAAAHGILAQSFPLALNGWKLETSMRTQVALAAVSGLQARILLVGVILTSAACLILLFPMRFLARPIAQLRDAALQVREGDFSARVPVESADEIGELSHSFNLMAEAVEERAEKLSLTARSLGQRKDELRSERDRLNAVILSMRDGLMVLDADGEPEVWNAAAEPLRAVVQSGGLDLGAHRNCHEAKAHVSPGPDAAHENGGANGEPVHENPCMKCLFEPEAPPRSCLIDAGPFVYEVHSTRLSSRSNGRSGRVLVARDVTDRVAQDEREIHQERLAVLGEVAAIMAHELNNPLAAISMFAQMIGSKLPPDSALQEDVKVIERNTKTCSRTIRELLDYATGATPEVGPVDVHASLREVASFLRAFRERGETELVLTLEAEDSVVKGDEVQLRQVFVNLVMNALQAVGEGRVEVRTWLEDTHLVIDVQDDGPGISSDVGDTVFRPFYTTKPRGAGTGLGLSTARRITEIQGGGLALLDGRPGQTTFRVRLLRGNP